ncbi:MAG TPA: hypothetical protein VMZ53_03595 [Kofleriaceae bacterium]|nr:hypothetical protein [Kofleriaceae bacterium]
MATQTLYAIRNNLTGTILTGADGKIATWADRSMASLRAREYGLGFGSFAIETEPAPTDSDLVTVREAQPEEPGEGIPPAPWLEEGRGVLRTAVADRCASCKLPAHLTDVPNTNEQHPALGLACFACRDTHDTGAKLLAMLSAAPSCQLSRPTMARKLGRTASSIDRALAYLQRERLIERAYKSPNIEKPSATTYKLTDAGSRAHFANTEHKEQHAHA